MARICFRGGIRGLACDWLAPKVKRNKEKRKIDRNPTTPLFSRAPSLVPHLPLPLPLPDPDRGRPLPLPLLVPHRGRRPLLPPVHHLGQSHSRSAACTVPPSTADRAGPAVPPSLRSCRVGAGSPSSRRRRPSHRRWPSSSPPSSYIGRGADADADADEKGVVPDQDRACDGCKQAHDRWQAVPARAGGRPSERKSQPWSPRGSRTLARVCLTAVSS